MQGVERSHYDVVVVGAGPAGATLGYFLGRLGRKVLLVEKKKFPRDKHCGDAVCKIAIEILQEMGVLEELIRENKAHVVSCTPTSSARTFYVSSKLSPSHFHFSLCLTSVIAFLSFNFVSSLPPSLPPSLTSQADSGGLCSPGGLSFVGRSKEVLGEIPAAIACKRILLDETIVRAAQRCVVMAQ